MHVLIIEDEESAFENLKRILLEIDPTIQIISWLQSVEKSIHWFKTNDFPDLIFLDIQLSDDLSFKIFESVEVTSPIVFTTAFDEYAIKAFELNSIDYILKPISRNSIEKSITKYQSRINRSPKSYNSLIQDLKSLSINPSYKERFLVNKADELLIVPTANISYFFKDDDTYIVLKNGDRYAIKFTLDELIHLLDPIQFYRINRQMIVSINAISKITLWFKGKLKLRLIPEFDEPVFVSREGATKFKAWMDK
ncbi:Sensory transduction protein LytR [compost metagenome]